MTAARRSSRTRKKDRLFFEHLAQHGVVSDACAVAGYPRRCVYDWRRADAEFAENWREADEQYVERMEKEADRRAMDGTLEPVFYQGEECGQVRRYSDNLLMFRLKAKRPETYRERVSAEVSGPAGAPIAHEVTMTAAEAYRKLKDGNE